MTIRADTLLCVPAPALAAAFASRAFTHPATTMAALPRAMIVNIQSPAGIAAFGGATGYVMARWALHGLSEALRADYHQTGLRVVEVILGETQSNYFEANPGSHERIPRLGRLIPGAPVCVTGPSIGADVKPARRNAFREYSATAAALRILTRLSRHARSDYA